MGGFAFGAQRLSLQTNVKWLIANGFTCLVFNSPWCPNWLQLTPMHNRHRTLCVSTLLNTQHTSFDFPKMQSILGPVHASIIAQSYEYHNFSPTIPDKLIFTFASNGLFTLKQGYQLLSQLHHRAPTVPQHAPSPIPWSIL